MEFSLQRRKTLTGRGRQLLSASSPFCHRSQSSEQRSSFDSTTASRFAVVEVFGAEYRPIVLCSLVTDFTTP